MSIASEIARLQAAKVDIMAALVEKGVDVTGKNISDVGDLIRSIEVSPSNVVRIGEHDYPVVKIGNQYWTTANLKESIGTINADYFKFSDSTVDTYGFYYKYDTICLSDGTIKDDVKKIIPNGWRVPTRTDYDILMMAYGLDPISGGYPNMAGPKLKSTSMWKTINGNNESGFNLFPSGHWNSSDGFNNQTVEARLFTTSRYPSEWYFGKGTDSPSSFGLDYRSTSYINAYTVRLVKDA